MSVCARPIVAATKAVTPPTTATTNDASCVRRPQTEGFSPSVFSAHSWEMRKKTLQRATM